MTPFIPHRDYTLRLVLLDDELIARIAQTQKVTAVIADTAETLQDDKELGAREETEQVAKPTRAKMIVTKSFAERWTDNPQHYRDYFGIDDVKMR